MHYEIIELEEKKLVGLKARTCNQDKDMPEVIGGLWQRLMNPEIFMAIPNRVNEKCIGLYSDYESDLNGKYDITVGCEVSKVGDLPQTMVSKTIPAGKYAKFVVLGHVQQAVAEFWTKLWAMDLDRKYSADFEEYQSGDEMDQAEIHIYIALK